MRFPTRSPLLLGLALLAALAAPSAAQGDPGEVLSSQMIADGIGGLSGSLLNVADQFGQSLASLGDLNGDGTTDVAVGAPLMNSLINPLSDFPGGVVIMRMEDDGTVQSSTTIRVSVVDIFDATSGTPGHVDQFGAGVAAVDDFFGDGADDLAVGAPGADDGDTNSGAVWLVDLNATGTPVAAKRISQTTGGTTPNLDGSDAFGSSVADIGDLDNNGVRDLLVGAPGDDDTGSNKGAAYILYMAANGTVNTWTKVSGFNTNPWTSLGTAANFGTAVAGLGDLDGDNVEDFAVGVPGHDLGGPDRGAVFIIYPFMNGLIKDMHVIGDNTGGFTGKLSDGDRFGSSLAYLGDQDGDGRRDLAIGAIGDAAGGSDSGGLWIVNLDALEQARRELVLNDDEGGLVPNIDLGDEFGSAVCDLGDLDGDGRRDVMVGVPLDDTGATNRGAVHTLFLNAGKWENLFFNMEGSNGLPSMNGTGPMTGGDPASVSIKNGRSSSPSVIFVGFDQINVPLYGGTLVPDIISPAHLIVVVVTDSNGNVALPVASWPSTVPQHTEIYLQAWFEDPAGWQGYSSTNGLRATTP